MGYAHMQVDIPMIMPKIYSYLTAKIPLHAWPPLCLSNIHGQNKLPLRLILEKSKDRLWERVESLCSLESQVSSFLKHVVGWESGL